LKRGWDCGAYIGAIRDRQAIRPPAASDIKPLRLTVAVHRYGDFIKVNLF
jgi:hypothetical protein